MCEAREYWRHSGSASRAWLGMANSQSALLKWAAHALDTCPKRDFRQQSFLELLQGGFESAATLLATASGLGWSDHESQLIAACVVCDRSMDTAGWLTGLRARYRRFPALRSELDRALG